MSADTDPNGLLEDLLRLSEAGRDRYLKVLQQQDIVQVLKAALRELDEVKKAKDATADAARFTETPTPATHKRLRDADEQNEDSAGNASDKEEQGRQRGLVPTTAKTAKKRRLQTNYINLSHEGQRRQEGATHQPTVKRDLGFLESDNVGPDERDDSTDKYESAQYDTATSRRRSSRIETKPRPEYRRYATDSSDDPDTSNDYDSDDSESASSYADALLAALPIVLRVPDEEGGVSMHPIDRAPATLQDELKRRYKEMWSPYSGRTSKYKDVAAIPKNIWGGNGACESI